MWYVVLFCLLVSSAQGASINTTNGRIVGGSPADKGEYPAQVSVALIIMHTCGGSIINENYVLTAAHCVEGVSTSFLQVTVGTNSIREGGVQHDVKEVIVHSDYVAGDHSGNDIALLEVTSPFKFNDLVQPVTLPQQNLETPAGSKAMAIGWGKTSNNGSASTDLLEVEQQIRDHQECYDIYEEDVHITDAQICADVPEGGRGVCHGDSGGPLYVNGTIVGIVSWSANGCAVQGYPAVYTRVASYIDWIDENIK